MVLKQVIGAGRLDLFLLSSLGSWQSFRFTLTLNHPQAQDTTLVRCSIGTDQTPTFSSDCDVKLPLAKDTSMFEDLVGTDQSHKIFLFKKIFALFTD